MDVSFNEGRLPFIGAGTSEGVCINLEGEWKYVAPDQPIPFNWEYIWYRSVYFSPWNDSIAFVGANGLYSGLNEPASIGSTIINVHSISWAFGDFEIGGGFIGFNPSLSFEFSPHHENHVYTWIIDFYKSTDNGEWWEPQMFNDSYGAFFLSFDQTEESVLYAGRKLFSQQEPAIYRSTDDGASWSYLRDLPQTIFDSGSQRTTEMFTKGDTLILVINRFPIPPNSSCGIFISTDYGNTWTDVLPNTNVQKIIQDPQNEEVFYAAVQGGIYISYNYGMTWQLFNNSLPSLNLVDIRKDPYSDTLYVASSDMGIYKVFDKEVNVENEFEIPSAYKLFQNYPNPFNPSTIISYELPHRSNVILTVYDILGNTIATLVNDVKEAGKYEVVFQTENLSSGIYIYNLRSDNFIQSRKMILIK
jgi:hypothetical protein